MRSLPWLRPAQLTISEHTRPAPKRLPWRRKACTLTPAIGASTTRVGISTGPMCHGDRMSTAMAGNRSSAGI